MVGEIILHYQIIEKLGEGGMGEVYKARDTKLDRFIALKFLPSQLTDSEDDKLRFMHEAKAASAIIPMSVQFYCTGDQKLMAVSIETNPKFTIGIPKELFKADLWVYSNIYAVLDNGQHFLINKISTSSFSKPLKVIVNWKSLLNQK